MASKIEELTLYFEEKYERIRHMLEFRGIEYGEDSTEVLRSLYEEMNEIDEMIIGFKAKLREREKSLKEAEKLKDILQNYEERNKYISLNMPNKIPCINSTHSDGDVLSVTEKVTSDENEGKVIVKAEGKFSKCNIDYLTIDEFESLPKYLKGRLNHEKVNAVIDQVNIALNAKYKIIATNRKGMSEVIMKKYREYKKQESEETKECYFIVNQDLTEFTDFKMDKVGMTILNILRHCGRLREVRSGKLIRFVAMS